MFPISRLKKCSEMKLAVKLLSTIIISFSYVTQASAARNEHRPVCSNDGTRLIYMLQSEQTNNDWELYLKDIESEVHARLTSHPGWDGYAVWSPDDSQVVYDREDEPGGRKRPWIMDMEKRTTKPLGQFDGWLSVSDWAEPGQMLGFQELAGQRDLVMVDVESNMIETITTTSR